MKKKPLNEQMELPFGEKSIRDKWLEARERARKHPQYNHRYPWQVLLFMKEQEGLSRSEAMEYALHDAGSLRGPVYIEKQDSLGRRRGGGVEYLSKSDEEIEERARKMVDRVYGPNKSRPPGELWEERRQEALDADFDGDEFSVIDYCRQQGKSREDAMRAAHDFYMHRFASGGGDMPQEHAKLLAKKLATSLVDDIYGKQ